LFLLLFLLLALLLLLLLLLLVVVVVVDVEIGEVNGEEGPKDEGNLRRRKERPAKSVASAAFPSRRLSMCSSSSLSSKLGKSMDKRDRRT